MEAVDFIRTQIKRDDPNLFDVAIGSGTVDAVSYRGARAFVHFGGTTRERAGGGYLYTPQDGDWEGLGCDIAKNTAIKKLAIFLDWGDDEQLERFANGLSSNKSIVLLTLVVYDDFAYNFSLLVPFLKRSRAQLMIEIGLDRMPSIPEITSAFEEIYSMRELVMNSNDDIDGGKLSELLSVHSNLEKLRISGDDAVDHGVCLTVSHLLQSETCKLTTLDFNVDDDDASIFASGLEKNNTLKELDLSCNTELSVGGCHQIFRALQSTGCNLEKLLLFATKAAASGLSLCGVLAKHGASLRVLDLGGMDAAVANWHSIFMAIHNNCHQLEDINLEESSWVHFATSLIGKRSLKRLKLCGMNTDAEFGSRNVSFSWGEVFSTVLDRTSALVSLDVSRSEMNDDDIIHLVYAVVNSNLKELRLAANTNITRIGWESLTVLLRNPYSSLEKLDLSYNRNIDGDLMASFAAAVAHNHTLKELKLHDCNELCVPDAERSFLPVLCNRSSIIDTMRSNHTLHTIINWNREVHPRFDTFKWLLNMNRVNDARRTARLKIIWAHFNRGYVAPPFVGMALNVLPQAISWMGRSDVNTDLDGRLYHFIRSNAVLLCDTGAHS